MIDVHTPEGRSRNMRAVKSKNTVPERLLRSALHKRGFRFRIHSVGLPGRPDLVLRKFGAVVFVNGCFWHGHGCHLFRMPRTRSDFWAAKIATNVSRDAVSRDALLDAGWRVATVWECSLKGRYKKPFDSVVDEIINWLNKPEVQSLDIRGLS